MGEDWQDELEEGEIPCTSQDGDDDGDDATSCGDDEGENENEVYASRGVGYTQHKGYKQKVSQRRQAKKRKQKVLAGKGNKQDYFDVYGPDALPELVFQRQKGQDLKLRPENIAGLITWILGQGVMPNWILVRNKPVVTKVVLLFVPGIDAALFMGRPDLFRNIVRCCGNPWPLLAISPLAEPKATARALLSNPVSRKRKQPPSRLQPWKASKSPRSLVYNLNGDTTQPERSKNGKPVVNTSSGDVQVKSGAGKKSSTGMNHDRERVDLEPASGRGHDRDTSTPKVEASLSLSPIASSTPPFPPTHYLLSDVEMKELGFPQLMPSNDGGPPLPPPGYAVTGEHEEGTHLHEMVAIDCEMCYTCEGLELTRVTLVDVRGRVVYDRLVLPENKIRDYNTQYSGITAAMMEGVTTTLQDVQRDVLRIVSAETIIVGHSLQSDLTAMRLVHTRVIDTSILFPHPKGPPFRPALRVLSQRFLSRTIQSSARGHDSAEDARAALDLVLIKIRRGPSFGIPSPTTNRRGESVLVALEKEGVRAAVVDRCSLASELAPPTASVVACNTDDDVIERAQREAKNDAVRFVWARLTELSAHLDEAAKTLEAAAEQAAKVAAMLTCQNGAAVRSHLARRVGNGHTPVEEEVCRGEGWNMENQGEEREEREEDGGEPRWGQERDERDRLSAAASRAVPPLSLKMEAVLRRVDDRVAQLHSSLPRGTVMVVVTGQGDTALARRYKELYYKQKQSVLPGNPSDWAEASEEIMAEICARAKLGLAFFTVKSEGT